MSSGYFKFNEKTVKFRIGQSLAAALTEAGIFAFRHTPKGEERGLFCGMGVCQDCLLTVDGIPNRRACMTKATDGQNVKQQVAFPVLGSVPISPKAPTARKLEPDVAIIGGGAGGLSAAIAARASGASVVVLDERKVGGGQYYKQAVGHYPLDDQQQEGAALLSLAKESGAEIIGSVEIWGAFDGPLFLAECNGAAYIIKPKTVIISTGAYERPVMVRGWTLPGVMTTGAAQTLWRSYRTLPGQRVAVCGSGPLNAQLALELVKGGAEVTIMAESAPPPWRAPITASKAAIADPALIGKGLLMLRDLKLRGVALHYRTRLKNIERHGNRLTAQFQSTSGQITETNVDAICMNTGFEPQNEILRLLGAEMSYETSAGHLRCQRTKDMETSVPNVFAVGDCTGLGGAPAARAEGTIAGKAAAARLGFDDTFDLTSERRKLARHRRFQANLWKLYDTAPKPIDEKSSDFTICRCEEIKLSEVLDGLETNPSHVGTLKRATRVGMGRCQGRYCGAVAARLVAEATGKPMQDMSYFAPRVPMKPVSIASILAVEEALSNEN
jgi:thioredoxin reductase